MGGIDAVRAVLRLPSTRGVSEPAMESSTRAARDAFDESLDTSLGLVRMRVKDRKMRVEIIKVGSRTKTSCALLYVQDMADPAVLQVVRARMNAINVDGTLDDSLVEQYLSDRIWSPFPQMRPAERPDWVVWELLQGKVAILVDGSATAILGPVTLPNFYRTSEDLKHGFWEGLCIRNFLRIIAFALAIYLPALYVALTDVNPSMLPTQLALSNPGSPLHADRSGVAARGSHAHASTSSPTKTPTSSNCVVTTVKHRLIALLLGLSLMVSGCTDHYDRSLLVSEELAREGQ